MVDANIQCNLRARIVLEGECYLGGPFPYQGSNRECSHTPADVEACAAAGKVYLQDSSG